MNIKPPTGARIYLYGFGVLWVGFLGTVVVQGLVDEGFQAGVLILVVVFIAPVVVMVATAHRPGIVSDGSTLVVRGQLRTRSFAAADIEGFRIARLSARPACVFVLLRTGPMVELMLTAQPAFVGKRPQRCLAELEAWLAATKAGG